MGIMYKIMSSDVFLRSGGRNQISVVKLRKDVSSSKEVGRMDWEIVEIVGIDMTYDSLEVLGQNLQGETLKELAMNLCVTRLWVNVDGICFVRSGAASASCRAMYTQTDETFDWDKYGVKKPDDESSDDEEEGERERRHWILPEQFEMQQSKLNYEFNWKRPVHYGYTYERIPVAPSERPKGPIKVHVTGVGKKNFDTKDWYYVKVKERSSGEVSFFALYEGISGGKIELGYDAIYIPHHEDATCTCNYPISLLTLSGSSRQYGFRYTCIEGKNNTKTQAQQKPSSSFSNGFSYNDDRKAKDKEADEQKKKKRIDRSQIDYLSDDFHLLMEEEMEDDEPY